MLENSTAGLYMLDPARDVTVTREEDHQHVLARYPVTQRTPRRVAVELTWCTVASGKHKGTRAIEVRLDGHRTGELTRAMSDRYAPFVEAVTAAGLRPGCEATISSGDRGLQIQLHLPPGDAPLPNPRPLRPTPTQSTSAWTPPPARPTPFPASTAQFPTPPPSTPPTARQPGGYRPHIPGYPVTASTTTLPTAPGPAKKSKKVPLAFAGAVVGMVALISGIAAGDDETPQAGPPAVTATTPFPTTTSPTTRPTTTRPTTTTKSTTARPTTTRPTTRPTTTRPAPPPPKPEPAPESGCDPNYRPCVPIDSDVDCAGGSGNGPSYVEGTVEVIGQDIYDLDRDNDGEGCE